MENIPGMTSLLKKRWDKTIKISIQCVLLLLTAWFVTVGVTMSAAADIQSGVL